MSFNSQEYDSEAASPSPESAIQAAPVAADQEDPPLPDLEEENVQSKELERSGQVQQTAEATNSGQEGEMSKFVELQPVTVEASNTGRKGKIQSAVNGVNSRKMQSDGDEKLKAEIEEEDGNRRLRENLNGCADGKDAKSTDSHKRESNPEQKIVQSDVAMELINSVIALDEEGRSRQRILNFAAKRYAAALEKNPDDYDALYNWALVLQESADNVSTESRSPSKDALLEEACRKYEEATQLCPTLNDAFYNWAIAISDRAKLRGRTKEAEELWKQATKNYEKAVQLNWNSPQALNNWGLALQELSSIIPVRDKQTIVKAAISKFRAAIRLQYDFHRAIYNLGTVLYGLAEDITRTGHRKTKELSPEDLYSQSAIYIAAAHALKPNYSVYTSALKLVRSMLPLPYLKTGYLAAAPVENPIAPHNKWRRTQFVLNHELLQENSKDYKDMIDDSTHTVRVAIHDIISVSACADLTLPKGAGICIDTIHKPIFLVADSWESLDGWLDAIRLVYTIFARSRTDVLASIVSA